jgi:hypothetical protein
MFINASCEKLVDFDDSIRDLPKRNIDVCLGVWLFTLGKSSAPDGDVDGLVGKIGRCKLIVVRSASSSVWRDVQQKYFRIQCLMPSKGRAYDLSYNVKNL